MGDDARLINLRDRERGREHVLKWLAERDSGERYFTPSDKLNLFRKFVQTHLRIVFDDSTSGSRGVLDPLLSCCVVSYTRKWNSVSLTDFVHASLASSKSLLDQFSLSKLVDSSSNSSKSSSRAAEQDSSPQALTVYDCVVNSFVRIMMNAQEHSAMLSYSHVNVSAYMKCIFAFCDSIRKHSERHENRVKGFKAGIDGVKCMKREIKRVAHKLKSCTETLKTLAMKQTKLETELNGRREVLKDLKEESEPAEKQFAQLFENVQNLNQKKSEHDEGISKLSTEAAGILGRVNTHRVLDTFKEKDPPEIVMWIVESIAIVIGEHDCSGTALDWKSGHLFREDASLISRLSDAAPRFANWDRAVMKRVWNVDEIECIDIVDLAKWFLLRKRIYEKQASFQPFLQELQNLEPELEKERIMIQRVRSMFSYVLRTEWKQQCPNTESRRYLSDWAKLNQGGEAPSVLRLDLLRQPVNMLRCFRWSYDSSETVPVFRACKTSSSKNSLTIEGLTLQCALWSDEHRRLEPCESKTIYHTFPSTCLISICPVVRPEGVYLYKCPMFSRESKLLAYVYLRSSMLPVRCSEQSVALIADPELVKLRG